MSQDKFALSEAFGPDHAAAYDNQFEELQAIKGLLHLILETGLGKLPDNARILVAGAGTGAEVRYLATRFPNWQFALIDPSSAMLDVARRHAEAEGFAARCTFHNAYVSEVEAFDFDGATSLLVSHFLTQADPRIAYFCSIADRLRPGAPLFNADLCANMNAPDFPRVMELWLNLLSRTGMTPEGRAHYQQMFGAQFACHGPAKVEHMMQSAGFALPAQCMQAGLIRGWLTAKA